MAPPSTDPRAVLAYARRLLAFAALLALPALAVAVAVEPANRARVCDRRLRGKLDALVGAGREYEVLVLGDSRAELQVDPAILEAELGLPPGSCLNLGVRAGDLSSAVKALRTRPELLAGRPALLVSVSIFSLNDGATGPGYYSADLVSDCTPLERLRLFGPSQLTGYYVDSVRELLGLRREREPLSDASGYARTDAVLKPRFDVRVDAWHASHPWYRRMELDGIRAGVVARHLGWLGSLALPVIVYDAPIAPSWRAYVSGSHVEASDRAFAALLGELCERAGVRFASYRDRPGIGDEGFRDMQHVNHTGATVLSRWLAEELEALAGP